MVSAAGGAYSGVAWPSGCTAHPPSGAAAGGAQPVWLTRSGKTKTPRLPIPYRPAPEAIRRTSAVCATGSSAPWAAVRGISSSGPPSAGNVRSETVAGRARRTGWVCVAGWSKRTCWVCVAVASSR